MAQTVASQAGIPGSALVSRGSLAVVGALALAFRASVDGNLEEFLGACRAGSRREADSLVELWGGQRRI